MVLEKNSTALAEEAPPIARAGTDFVEEEQGTRLGLEEDRMPARIARAVRFPVGDFDRPAPRAAVVAREPDRDVLPSLVRAPEPGRDETILGRDDRRGVARGERRLLEDELVHPTAFLQGGADEDEDRWDHHDQDRNFGVCRRRVLLVKNPLSDKNSSMFRRLAVALFALLPGCASEPPARVQAPPAGFHQPDAKNHPDLFVWTDTCNVYVLRDGDAAILIDLGDGSIVDHLAEIGVKRIEWVLFTHHHREQGQGSPRLKGSDAKIAGPDAEAPLFENPSNFRRMNVKLGDPFTVHGASYVRPPVQPIKLDRKLKRMETFAWRGRELWCLDTRGNSPGSMSYFLNSKEARSCEGSDGRTRTCRYSY